MQSAAPIQSVVRARSETEAAWMIAEAREGTKLIAGGTDLMLHIDRGRASPVGLVDVRRAGMDYMRLTNDAIEIGACASASSLARWDRLQTHATGLWEAAATLSVPQIRNAATIGGNVANASPAADMVPPLCAMDAVVVIRNGDDTRRVSVNSFAKGPGRSVLEKSDLVTRIDIPRWRDGAFHHFCKLGFRDAQIIAVCSLAISIDFEGDLVRKVGIALGSVAAKVCRASHVEEFLLGKRLTRDVGAEALHLLAKDISPIDDIRSEAAFRLRVSQNYLADALARASLHQRGHDAHGLKDASPDVLAYLRDPAPRPPSIAKAVRTRALDDAKTAPAGPIDIRPTDVTAFLTRAEQKRAAKAPAKKATKKAAKKKPAAKKAASKKVAKKKPSTKKKTTKKAVAKKAATKKVAKKRVAKKKPAATKKAATKKVAKKRAAKKKPATTKKKVAKKAPKKRTR